MPAVRIKDHWREQRLFDQRSIIGAVIMGLATLGLVARLYVLQVIRHDYYSELSQGNRVRTEPIPAARGLILDRAGEVIAGNQPAYQLELVPEEVPGRRRHAGEPGAARTDPRRGRGRTRAHHRLQPQLRQRADPPAHVG